jgi:nucleoside-diphosphate-sugar epimerase
LSAKILVTGGAGYIGSVLVPRLLSEGHEVTVVDNLMYSQDSLSQCALSTKFHFVSGDIRNNTLMKELCPRFDVIIPLAAYVGAPLCKLDPVGADSTNRKATIDILKSLSSKQLVLMPTTNSAYGKGDKDNFCDETSPLNPVSEYAAQKVEVEKCLMERENSISFRLATVFGMSPRMRLDLLVNDFTWRASKDGFIVLFEPHFKRNYIHIQDVANVFLHGLNGFSKMKGDIYNVGLSEANLSKMELCQRIKKFVPAFTVLEAPIGKDPDQRDYIVSNKKIEGTGFRPKVGLDDGIRELLEGFKMMKRPYSNV